MLSRCASPPEVFLSIHFHLYFPLFLRRNSTGSLPQSTPRLPEPNPLPLTPCRPWCDRCSLLRLLRCKLSSITLLCPALYPPKMLPQYACLPVDDISNLLSSSSAFTPAASSDATPLPGGFMQVFAESCAMLDAVSVATLALLGLTDREICDAAGGEATGDLLGSIAEPKQTEASEFVRKIVSASGVDLISAKAAAAAAKLPPNPPESTDSMRERRESTVSNTSDGSNQDSLFSSDGFRSSEGGRVSPLHPSFFIRSSDSSAVGVLASAIAPPPAPATQVRGCTWL
jgi:hypothetical protein